MSRRAKLLPLTALQREIAAAIHDVISVRGYAPTQAELADEFNRCTPTIHEHIGELVRKGWLTRQRYRVRGLQLTPAAQRALQPQRATCPHCNRQFDLNRQGANPGAPGAKAAEG